MEKKIFLVCKENNIFYVEWNKFSYVHVWRCNIFHVKGKKLYYGRVQREEYILWERKKILMVVCKKNTIFYTKEKKLSYGSVWREWYILCKWKETFLWQCAKMIIRLMWKKRNFPMVVRKEKSISYVKEDKYYSLSKKNDKIIKLAW